MIKRKNEISWFTSNNQLSEIYQQTGYRFAFAGKPSDKEVSEQCHIWVKCRDFLPDAVRATIINEKFSIYGFIFDPSTNPKIDLHTMRMLVYKPDMHYDKEVVLEQFEDKMLAGLILLNYYEKMMGIELSTLCRTKTDYKKTPVYLFIGAPEWMESPFLVSLYTFLIRLGDKQIKFKHKDDLIKKYEIFIKKYDLGELHDNDVGYLKTLYIPLHSILKDIKLLNKQLNAVFSNKDISNSSFHNLTGITSLINANTPIPGINESIKKYLG